MASVSGIASYSPPAKLSAMEKKLADFEPGLRALWNSSSTNHSVTLENIQQLNLLPGSYLTYNQGAGHCFIAFVPLDGTNCRIMKLTFMILREEPGVRDEKGNFFTTFQEFAIHYHLQKTSQFPATHQREETLVAQGFADGWEEGPDRTRQLRLHTFSDDPPPAEDLE